MSNPSHVFVGLYVIMARFYMHRHIYLYLLVGDLNKKPRIPILCSVVREPRF